MVTEQLRGSLARSVDLRYVGQGYELQVPWSRGVEEAFHRLHQQSYGYADRQRPVEIVNVRVRATAPTEEVDLQTESSANATDAELGGRQVFHEGAWRPARFYERSHLRVGTRIEGPAVVVEYSATTYLPPESAATVDRFGNLVIEVWSEQRGVV